MAKLVKCSRDLVAVVDDEDWPLVSRHRWQAHPIRSNYGGFYVKCSKLGYMHRAILRAPKGMLVDHIDGNGLNNRRSNLRLATRQQNCVNRRRGYTTRSGYRGVYPTDRPNRTWTVEITVNGRRYRLGRFDDKVAAAREYDALALEHFGEYAVLNFPRTTP